MRVDRFLEARFPGLSFSHIQRIVRKGELRVNGKRVETKDRLEAGQTVRIPPLRSRSRRSGPRASKVDVENRAFLKSIVLYEDDDMMVLNKPMGLAVQGGSGTTAACRRHARRADRQATGRSRGSCTGSTRTRPAASSSPRRGSPPPRWPRASGRATRARSTGRSLPACRA